MAISWALTQSGVLGLNWHLRDPLSRGRPKVDGREI